MKVLGISPLDKDATVTIVEDGEITYSAGEERFTRVKLQDGFPWNALADALRVTGTETGEISAVMYPFLEWQEETRLFRQSLEAEREFLEDSSGFESNVLVRDARSRTPRRIAAAVPGLPNLDERMDKGFVKTLAYKVLARESVVSRNVAKRGSTQWGNDAEAFHRKWSSVLEASSSASNTI